MCGELIWHEAEAQRTLPRWASLVRWVHSWSSCRSADGPLPTLSLQRQLFSRPPLTSRWQLLSGAAINRFLWFPSRMAPSVSLSLFTIASAIGWIWIPSVVLLSRQRSIAALPVAALAAVMMASGLRKIMPAGTRVRPHSSLPGQWKERELFAEYLNAAPREMHGFIIAVCLYGGLFAWHGKSLLLASFLLALCAFVLSWKLRVMLPVHRKIGRVDRAPRYGSRGLHPQRFWSRWACCSWAFHTEHFPARWASALAIAHPREEEFPNSTREPRIRSPASQDMNASSSGLSPRKRKLLFPRPPSFCAPASTQASQ